MSQPGAGGAAASRTGDGLILAIALLLTFGTLYRLWPVLAGPPALAAFFMTEDGYLMLTVARNIALGLGMSVAEGTIPTNGVQPLQTFLSAIPFRLTGGDKISALTGVHLLHGAIALAGAFACRAFAARLLAPRDAAPIWPWAVALLWFLGPLLVRHSMNGLETGLVTLMVLLTLLLFLRVLERGASAGAAARLGLGALCGLTFLARNDTAFLIVPLYLAWAADGLFRQRTGLKVTARRILPAGLMTLAVAAPWLLNNLVRFGALVPISGTAQRLSAEFGQNADLLPAKLFEHAFPMLPVPVPLEATALTLPLFTIVMVGVLGAFLWRMLRHMTPAACIVALVCLAYGAALCVYYGLWFGAPHFLSRYLAPLAPLLITASLAAALELGRVLRRPALPGQLLAGGGLGLCVVLLGLAFLPRPPGEGHRQVVDWVAENVPEQAWVGAVQTGTLGYWHDRTINLDGKVNPAALEARKREGHVLNYLVESEIDYIVDWQGVGGWVERPEAAGGFAEAFELVLRDREANLSVMRRREPRLP
ncbi:hypothetical protein [Tropicimonas sediminicola]|uniref:Dolichyl-phosphate-mannose-protein mannosyltransferase n=1 Tax=Tropicimonas sediminicola TaxID=1031541 RepID=A0A239HBW0_9RHOB|nr:hypothetical protein [Tropicimonas sediminicola]SNS78273.1 hypothetical protein SAMN05421757_103318 [Tropicimonas sediminicola]